MPTDDLLILIDEDKTREILKEILHYRGRLPVYLAVIRMFEAFVVLASKYYGYDEASVNALRKVDRTAANALKKARDLLAHKYYAEDEIADALLTIIERDALGRLYSRIFKEERKELTTRCKEFYAHIEFLCSPGYKSTAQKILELIPPALHAQLPEDETEAALQYAYDMIVG